MRNLPVYVSHMEHEMTPAERLSAIRLSRGFSRPEAIAAFGFDKNTYASHENGNRGISAAAARRYAKAFRSTTDEILSGPLKTGGVGNETELTFISLPHIDLAAMNTKMSLKKALDSAREHTALPKSLRIKQPAFSMTCVGDSMRNQSGVFPSFCDGDVLIFARTTTAGPGDFVLAEIISDDSFLFRQYAEREPTNSGFQSFDLCPLNASHRSMSVRAPGIVNLVAKLTHVIKTI
jgi:SOS-response transcriptional repressor LexA